MNLKQAWNRVPMSTGEKVSYMMGEGRLAGVLLCSAAVIVSLGIFLRFRRYPIEDKRPMPLPVRVSFGVFVIVLLLVGSALLLQVPNVFAWTLNPVSSALLGCFSSVQLATFC